MKEVSPLLPNPCHYQDYNRSLFPVQPGSQGCPPEDMRDEVGGEAEADLAFKMQARSFRCAIPSFRMDISSFWIEAPGFRIQAQVSRRMFNDLELTSFGFFSVAPFPGEKYRRQTDPLPVQIGIFSPKSPKGHVRGLV